MVFSCFSPDKVKEMEPENKVVHALKEQRLSFAFSGGGFLFPYHLGVAATLKELGLIDHDTPVSGVSAGALLAAALNR